MWRVLGNLTETVSPVRLGTAWNEFMGNETFYHPQHSIQMQDTTKVHHVRKTNLGSALREAAADLGLQAIDYVDIQDLIFSGLFFQLNCQSFFY